MYVHSIAAVMGFYKPKLARNVTTGTMNRVMAVQFAFSNIAVTVAETSVRLATQPSLIALMPVSLSPVLP